LQTRILRLLLAQVDSDGVVVLLGRTLGASLGSSTELVGEQVQLEVIFVSRTDQVGQHVELFGGCRTFTLTDLVYSL